MLVSGGSCFQSACVPGCGGLQPRRTLGAVARWAAIVLLVPRLRLCTPPPGQREGRLPQMLPYQHAVLPGGWRLRGQAPVAGAGPPNSGRPTGRAPGQRGQRPVQIHSSILCMDIAFQNAARGLACPPPLPRAPSAFGGGSGCWRATRHTPAGFPAATHQPQADFAWGACYYYLLTCRQGLPALHAQKLRGARGAVLCTSLPG